MPTPVVSLKTVHLGVASDENNAPASRAYRTKTSFVAVHFDHAGKGRIIFLPQGAMLQVVGRSSCLPGGFEVVFEHQHYNVFEIDILVRSTPICEPIQPKRPAVAA
jgi:hypothetical protein